MGTKNKHPCRIQNMGFWMAKNFSIPSMNEMNEIRDRVGLCSSRQLKNSTFHKTGRYQLYVLFPFWPLCDIIDEGVKAVKKLELQGRNS